MSEIKLKIKKRKEYLLFILSTFASGFLIYTVLVCYSIKYGNFNSPLSPAIYGIMGGYLFASIVSGIIIFVGIIKNKPLWVKIICAVLFLPVFVIIYFIGALTLIPYFFYNIICFIASKRKIKRLESDRVKQILSGQIIEQLMHEEIKSVKYGDIKKELRLFGGMNRKIAGIAGILIGIGLVLLFIQSDLLLNFVAFIVIAIGCAYLEEKRIYTYMRTDDHYSVGLLYVGYDEEFFGIFHVENELVRKSISKYRMLNNVKINGINRFIYNNDRKIIIIYR